MKILGIIFLGFIAIATQFHNIMAQPFNPSRQCQGESISLMLEDCRITSESVICKMQITSREREQDIQLTTQKSRMTIGGNHYKLSKFQLGGQEPQTRAPEHLSPGTPINLILHFEPIPPNTQGNARLELNMFLDRKWRIIPCTNVQIVR